MFGLIKWIVSAVMCAVVGYLVFFVSLGDKTLYQHLRCISETSEAKELGEGIRSRTDSVTREVGERLPEVTGTTGPIRTPQAIAEDSADIGAAQTAKADSPKMVTSARTPSTAPDVSAEDRSQLGQLLQAKLREP